MLRLKKDEMKIVAWMTVKDEEWYVSMAIRSVLDHVYKLLIIDTGSTDNTIDEIEKFKSDKIIIEQVDGFSAEVDQYGFYNRPYWINYILNKCLHFNPEYLLNIDADEYFLPRTFEILKANPGHDSYTFSTYDLTSPDGEYLNRVDVFKRDNLIYPHTRIVKARPDYHFMKDPNHPEFGYLHSQASYDGKNFIPWTFVSDELCHLHLRWLGPKSIRDEIPSDKGRASNRQLIENIDAISMHHIRNYDPKHVKVPPLAFRQKGSLHSPVEVDKNLLKGLPDIIAFMLVKNEEWYVAMAIRSILPYVRKLLILDTGSSDNTIFEINRFNSRKIDIEKVDGFSVEPDHNGFYNRPHWLNHLIKKALKLKPGYLLSIDADEYFTQKTFEQVINNPGKDNYTFNTYDIFDLEGNYMDGSDVHGSEHLIYPHTRIIKANPDFRYVADKKHPEHGFRHCHGTLDGESWLRWSDSEVSKDICHIHFRWLGPKVLRDPKVNEKKRCNPRIINHIDPITKDHLRSFKSDQITKPESVLKTKTKLPKTVSRFVPPAKVVAWMVIKDEEWYISMAIRSLLPYVEKLVIVDTGSTDGTIDIINKFNDPKIDLEQVDGYSQGIDKYGFFNLPYWNNYAVEKSKKYKPDYLLYTDGDEYFTEEAFKVLQEKPGENVYTYMTYDLTSVEGHYIDLPATKRFSGRLVKAKPEYHFIEDHQHPEYGYRHAIATFDGKIWMPWSFASEKICFLHFRWIGPKSVRDSLPEHTPIGFRPDLLNDVDEETLEHIRNFDRDKTKPPPSMYKSDDPNKYKVAERDTARNQEFALVKHRQDPSPQNTKVTIKDRYLHWKKVTLVPHVEHKVYVLFAYEGGGLGDIIMQIPAYRQIKRMYPNRQLAVFADERYLDIYHFCKYIDQVIPRGYVKNVDSLAITPHDTVLVAEGSLEKNVKKHMVVSEIERICNVEYDPSMSLEYELSIYQSDIPKIDEAKQNLLDIANGRKLIAIAPAFTFCHKMWTNTYWEKLVDLLHDANYCVVSFGVKKDLYVNNIDFDGKGMYPIRYIPHIFDIFESIFLLNSGMLHIAGINQDIQIVIIGSGPFPDEHYFPSRHGKIGYKVLLIDHNCPKRQECLKYGFAEDNNINVRYQETLGLVKQWEQETREPFPEPTWNHLHKYVTWNYCYKKEERFECSKKITPQIVFDQFKQSQPTKAINDISDTVDFMKDIRGNFKSCAIIGNGPYESDLSEEIDASFVIRLNCYVLNESTKDIGSKTHLNLSGLGDDAIPPPDRNGPVFCPFPIHPKYTKVSRIEAKKEGAQKIAYYVSIVKLIDENDSFTKEYAMVADFINACPTTGILAIALARFWEFEEIILTGFTCFRTTRSHYATSIITIPDKQHNVEQERNLIHRWITTDNRTYVIDELMKETLDLTTAVSHPG